MKTLSIVCLAFLAACTSNRVQDSIPAFSKEKVCSVQSLEYFKEHSTSSQVKKKISEEDIRARMLSLEPSIRKCYEEEMAWTGKHHSFNLCFVSGYSKTGAIDFFEFSTQEIAMTKEFKSCLSELKRSKELIGLKDLSILQPYSLNPKR